MRALDERLKQLRAGQKSWRDRGVRERLKVFARLREIISSQSDRIVDVISEENKKSRLEALTQEVVPTLDTLLFLEKNAERILGARSVKLKTRQFYFWGKKNWMVREPYGVIGILGTWNYPFYLSLTQCLFALAAGNAVVLKAAPFSERVTVLMWELLKEAGFPEDVFELYAGGRDAGEALCAADCDKYVLTGSRATGRAVLHALAGRLKPAIVELSGCDPYVVLPDADLKFAARALLWSAFQYSGQTCAASRRVFVLRSNAAQFRVALGEVWKDCEVYLSGQGHLRSEELVREERRKIEALVSRGARLEFGNETAEDERGNVDLRGVGASCIGPKVYSGLGVKDLSDMDFMAPVFFLIEVESEADLVDAVNSSAFALGASVWTKDEAKGMEFARRIRAGQIWINDAIFSVALGEVAFGGYKDSGFGKTRGEEGLLEMTESKFVSFDGRVKRFDRHLPPYEENSYFFVNAIQKILYQSSWAKKFKALTDMASLGKK